MNRIQTGLILAVAGLMTWTTNSAMGCPSGGAGAGGACVRKRTCVFAPAVTKWVGAAVLETTSGGGSTVTPVAQKLFAPWSQTDTRPGLVYFYWGEESDPRAQAAKNLQQSVFDTEEFARASTMFQCYKIDARQVPAIELARRGVDVRKLPTLVITDASTGHWTLVPEAKGAQALARRLASVLQASLPAAWGAVQKAAAEQKAAFEEARAASKRQDFARALELLKSILEAPVKTDILDRALDMKGALEPRQVETAKK